MFDFTVPKKNLKLQLLLAADVKQKPHKNDKTSIHMKVLQ